MRDNTYRIGVTGGSGSGKSSFIRDLRLRFSEEELCIVSLDDYYKPREEQKTDDRGVKNFDLPESIDVEALVTDLEKLGRQEVVKRIEYTFNNENVDKRMLIFKPAPIMIIEGLFVLHYARIKNSLDLEVFVEANDVLKVKRRILRDQLERNYPIEDVLYRYEHHVLPAYEHFIKPYKDGAHIIINNNENYDTGLDVLCGFIRAKLLE
jgi:uridine kinase